MTTEQIVSFYDQCQSIAETGRHFGVSDHKIRRVLIDAGAYMTAQSKQILKLYDEGLSPEEIGKKLNLSRSTVFSNLPYSKGQYNSDTPTENAIKIRKCRESK